MAQTASKMIFLQLLLQNVGHCDNQAAINISNNPTFPSYPQ